jgi:hypothetical protein
MSSVNNNPHVQPAPPPPPPPPKPPEPPEPPVENKNAEVYGPPLPKSTETQAANDAQGTNNVATENKSPAQMSADNHSVADLAKLKGAPAEVPATRPKDTVSTDAGELTRDEYNKRYKPESDGSISNTASIQAEFKQAKPENLWDSTTRAVGDFTSGLMNGRPGANGSGEVNLKTATDAEILSAQNMNPAQLAGANIHESYDRTSSALDKGLTETQNFGNNLANRDLFEGVDQNKLTNPNGVVDLGSSVEVLKVEANYVAKVAGEGIDLVAGLGKAVGGVVNGVPQWAGNAGDLASGKEEFNVKEAAAATFSGVSKVGYGLATGLFVDLPSRILAPGQGHDAVAKGVGEVQKTLDDSYRSDLKSAGLNPDSKTYKTVNEATEVVGNVTAIFAGGKGKAAGVAENTSAIVKAETPGALVKSESVTSAIVKAEPPGALVKTEKGGTGASGNGTTPQKLLTGTPDRPMLKASELEPLPDLASLKRGESPAATGTPNSAFVKPVEVEVIPPETAASPAKATPAAEPTTIDVTPSASRRAYTEITPEQLNFPTRQARDGTTIVSESYKGPTAKLQREAFQSQFEMRNAQAPGMQPHIEILDKASGKVVGEVPNARLETTLDFGVNVADRLTKPAASTGKLADTPAAEVLGRAEKFKGVFDKVVKLWDSLTNPKPPTSAAPNNIPDQIARHKEMMREIESQRETSDPAKERTVPNSELPENRVLNIPGVSQRPVVNLPERLGEPLPDLGSIPRNESLPGITEPELVDLPDNANTTPPEQLRMPPPGFDPDKLSPAHRAEYNADPQAYIQKYFGN